MDKPYKNVCEVIVKNDFCIGCGVCAGICPVHVLKMKFNDYGEYQPVEHEDGCLPKCDLCLRACPFWNQDENEDSLAKAAFGEQTGINHSDETGYYLENYVGYSNVDGHRANGSSGGVTTWLLETLLSEGLVDNVICVGQNPDSNKLFKFSVINSVERIRENSRSCYYPVELSEVIDYVLHNDGKYVVTGLPCFIKGLRLAMRKNRYLRERIVYLVGLTCGQMQSKYFAEYLCTLRGGNPKKLKEVRFRVKDKQRPASDNGFSFNCSDGKKGEIFWSSGMGEVWHNGYFRPNACGYCDDIFAECADIVLMDAWLPEYRRLSQGNNILLIRSQEILSIIQSGITQGVLNLTITNIHSVILSQQDVIKKKRYLSLYSRVKVGANDYVPQKRNVPKRNIWLHDIVISEIIEKKRLIGRGQFQNNPRVAISSPWLKILNVFERIINVEARIISFASRRLHRGE